MKQYIDKAAVVAEIEKLKLCTMDEHMNFYSEAAEGEYHALFNLESFLDTLEVKEVKEEPESEDLEEAVENYAATGEVLPNGKVMINFQAEKAFRAGANWQKKHLIDKACEWLEEHKEHPFIGCEDPCLSGYLTDEFIEDFKKYMGK